MTFRHPTTILTVILLMSFAVIETYAQREAATAKRLIRSAQRQAENIRSRAAKAPEDIHDIFKDRMAVSDQRLELYNSALAAAEGGDSKKASQLIEPANRLRDLGRSIDRVTVIAQRRSKIAAQNLPKTGKIDAYKQRLEAVLSTAKQGYQVMLADGEDPDKKKIQTFRSQVELLVIQSGTLRELINSYGVQGQVKKQLSDAKSEALKELYRDRLKLHADLVVANSKLAELPVESGREIVQQHKKAIGKIKSNVSIWQHRHQTAMLREHYETALKDAPESDRRLVDELLALREEATAVRKQIEQAQQTGAAIQNTNMLMAQVAGIDAEAQALEQILMIKQSATPRDSTGVQNDLIGKIMLDIYDSRAAKLEKEWRRFGAMTRQAYELRGKADLLFEELNDAGRALQKIMDLARSTTEIAVGIDGPVDRGTLEAIKAEADQRLKDLEKNHDDLGEYSGKGHMSMIREAHKTVSGLAAKGLTKLEAGDEKAARKAMAQAEQWRTVIIRAEDPFRSRVGIERSIAKKDAGDLSDKQMKALQAYRLEAEALTGHWLSLPAAILKDPSPKTLAPLVEKLVEANVKFDETSANAYMLRR